ncbi:MAG: hypothetical protein DCC59_03525 [Chloroflexi bacterium]|nr:hypothetical protein [Chloroflexi bacterium CFX1]MCK6566282.1 hypothetical protein [Anaerolineales bacterium]MCQ3954783.1 hypothetical protein [Chloroflexota bacterium]MDL1920872.1 hypothetical protein [Chloroflexi bacterium CFX5]NUQ59291.1 hypothetical protein [Anaerolineales bacterium]
MSKDNFIGWVIARTIGVLILLSLIGGAGYMAYQAGVAQGIAQAPEVAVAIEKAAEEGAPVPPMYGHGYGYGYGYPQGYGFGHPHRFFNPFGAVCLSIFFLFLFLGFMKMMFFRRMRHGWGHHNHWKKDWDEKVPPFFEEWHKRAHGEKPEEKE